MSPKVKHEDLIWKADLPIETVQPKVHGLYQKFKVTKRDNAVSPYPGISSMAHFVEVSDYILRDILDKRIDRVSYVTVDKLCRYADFSLDDILEETIMWAKNNPDPGWPENYVKGIGAKKKAGAKDYGRRYRKVKK